MFRKIKRLLTLMMTVTLLPVMQPALASAGTETRLSAPVAISASAPIARETAINAGVSAAAPITVSLPIVLKTWPWPSFFGVEVNSSFAPGSALISRAEELKVRWARLNGRISWRALQPTEGAAIDWSKLADFDNELRALRAAGITPLVIVDDNPAWATISNARNDGQPTSCAAIRPEKYGAFAQFMQQLVSRYQAPEFNVRNWELGNEIDVDPNIVNVNEVFGCWGQFSDEFYGGRRYGEMLKVVTPAIRAASPGAKVWMGGLLLDKPNTTAEGAGKPEKFLQGVLVAGGGPFFDVLPYHMYVNFNSQAAYDHDADPNLTFDWYGLGGRTVGKARFLRSIMAQYGVDKPLFLNETGFVCPNDTYETQPYCVPEPTPAFFQQQSNHLVRVTARALSEGVIGVMWYTLDGPGWRNGALLDAIGAPRVVFNTYKHLSTILNNTRYIGKTDYGSNIEGYRFSDDAREVQVVWMFSGSAVAGVPQSRFVAAYTRDGAPISPAASGANFNVPVGYEPVFIVLKP